MKFGWIRAFPKFALVFTLIVGSTVAFGVWWFVLRPFGSMSWGGLRVVEDIRPKLAKLEAKQGRLLLVDNDLYEVDSGTLIFKNWLQKHGMPQRLFQDGQTKRFIAQYDRGFVRYEPSGAVETALLHKFKPAFSDDLKWVLFARDKDIWRADVDWKEFKLANEKKVTAIEQFNETYFTDNIILGTEKTLVVRNSNKLLRVNLETGDVKPVRIKLNDVGKRRSPDSKWLVGVEGGQFYCYDVDSDELKTIPVGRGAMNDYQWLGNNRCVAIAAGRTVVLYDRLANTLNEIAALPSQLSRIGEPSPDGRFVFCAGRGTGVLVDLEQKTATAVTGGAGIHWISNDTFAFSREVPDSDLRGTWLQTAGASERRVSREPYLVGKLSGLIMSPPNLDMVIFATKHGLLKMKPDGSEVAELAKLPAPPSQVLGIQEWKPGHSWRY
jgi:hypothetical protein